MTIRKTKSGYIVQVDIGYKPDGKRYRPRKTFRTLREARAKETEWLAEKSARDGKPNMTLKAFIDIYFWAEKQNLDDGTLSGYRRDIRNRILPMLGDMSLSDIRHPSVQAMISACPTHKVAKNAHDTLSAVLGCAVQLGFLDVNPARGSWSYPKSSPKPQNSDGAVLQTWAEIRDVLDKAHDQPDKIAESILLLGLCLGLRKGEILALDWPDIENGCAHVWRTYTPSNGGMSLKVTKTRESNRVIPCPALLLDRLAELPAPHDGAIVNYRGQRVSGVTAARHIALFVESSGCPRVTCKSLRHSYATACIDSGVNVSVVSKLLGHTNVSTTYNRYVRPLDAAKHDAVNSIDSLL